MSSKKGNKKTKDIKMVNLSQLSKPHIMVYRPKESKIEEYNRLKRQGREKEYWDKYYPNRKKKPGETNSGKQPRINHPCVELNQKQREKELAEFRAKMQKRKK